MPLPHFLVAESEYLIAMEAERLLRELLPCEVTIVNPRDAAACAAIAWETVSLALLDTGFLFEEGGALAEAARRHGVPVAFTTASTAYARGVPGFPGTPVLGKPFDPERFAAAILSRRAAPITE